MYLLLFFVVVFILKNGTKKITPWKIASDLNPEGICWGQSSALKVYLKNEVLK